MTEITDANIKMLRSAAMVDEAIKACYKTLSDLTTWEADIRAQRLKCEKWLGEMIAAKMVLESHRDL